MSFPDIHMGGALEGPPEPPPNSISKYFSNHVSDWPQTLGAGSPDLCRLAASLRASLNSDKVVSHPDANGQKRKFRKLSCSRLKFFFERLFWTPFYGYFVVHVWVSNRIYKGQRDCLESSETSTGSALNSYSPAKRLKSHCETLEAY